MADIAPSSTGTILNLSFYRFTSLPEREHLGGLRARFQSLCGNLGLKGTILLSAEGINGFLAGPEDAIRDFQETMNTATDLAPHFGGIFYKESWSHSVPFRRMKVKLKNEIITMGVPGIRPTLKTGDRVPARDLKEWLDQGREVVLVDTRNDYEVDKGTFEGALDWRLKSFREFPALLQAHAEELKGKPVVMFCTGGIRCEKATALALELGIDQVYQLEGGIIRYFEEVGGAHYRGGCFVFDERVALQADLAPEREAG